MAALKLRLAFFIICAASCTQTMGSASVKIDNSLSSCVSLEKPKIMKEEKVPILSVELVVDKSIADCGCKSALGEYRVSSNDGGYRSSLIWGKVNLLSAGKRYLPASTDYNLLRSGLLEVSLSCAHPD